MSWQHIVLLVWLLIESGAQILTIGRDRQPRTPVEAVGGVVAFALIFALAVTGGAS